MDDKLKGLDNTPLSQIVHQAPVIENSEIQYENQEYQAEDYIDFDPDVNSEPDEEDFQDLLDEFAMIPNPAFANSEHEYEEGEEGPGPQTAAYRQKISTMKHILVDDNDERVVEAHSTAGKILYQQSKEQHYDKDGDTNMLQEEEDTKFLPFTSELDWKIAQWAVKDGPGHNAFNRLLKIPGVCIILLTSYITK